MREVPVDYLIARDGVPPPSGRAYDYLLTGDGLYVAAENRWLRARVPVARAAVRGLAPVYACVELTAGRLPQALWKAIVAVALARPESEALLAVTHEASGYRLVRPAQLADAVHVAYRPLPEALLEVHSHGRHPARFSPTDDADEQGFRLYGVIGRLGGDRSEVALRVGVYGHFLPLPWEAVFAGDRGAFRDRYAAPSEDVEEDDALRD
jgi:PRTRC genetic system protein A